MIGEAAASPHQGSPEKPGAARGIGQSWPSRDKNEPRRGEDTVGVRPVSLPVRLTGETISIVAMALATMAIGIALHFHFGLAVWAAVACAVFCYGGMLVAHALMPRHYLVESVPAAGSIARVPSIAPEGVQAEVSPSATTLPRPQPRPIKPFEGETAPTPPALGVGVPPLGGTSPAASPPADGGTRSSDSHSVRDQSAQPERAVAKDQSPAGQRPQAHVIAATPPPKSARASRPPSPRESDVEMIQGLIRKLAEEVNSASASPPKGAAEVAAASERAISTSLDALSATAETMRSKDEAAQRRQECRAEDNGDQRRTESGRPPEVNARLSALAEALALGRVEVLLDPILDFDAGTPRHFELYVRLRDEQGRILDTEQSREDFAGTGMLPRIDGARLAHASQIAVRFSGRGRDNALFSTVSGEALSAHKFLQGVAEAYRERRSVAGVLIMTFSQADVRGFGSREWQALSEFAGIGFRYCIAEVMDLDMDFEDLKSRGFDFVKLDAGVFLEGLPASNDVFIPAQDVCRHLAGSGFSVIVGGMDNEQVAAKVFGFGVLFGQGRLFGGAKPVKRELIAGRGTAVA